MKTVVLGDPPPALVSLIAERRRLGLDRHDEVWEGDYHMNPAPSGRHARLAALAITLLDRSATDRGLTVVAEFNLGTPDDYRIPDLGVLRSATDETWVAAAAVVVEIRSADDETFEKLGFYARLGVEEILIVDPAADADDTVRWLVREPAGSASWIGADRSAVLGLSVDEVRAHLGV